MHFPLVNDALRLRILFLNELLEPDRRTSAEI